MFLPYLVSFAGVKKGEKGRGGEGSGARRGEERKGEERREPELIHSICSTSLQDLRFPQIYIASGNNGFCCFWPKSVSELVR
jgi:hypothetical protein